MKTIRLSLAAIALAVAALPTFGGESGDPATASPRPHARIRAQVQRRGIDRAKLAERLGLTAEQREQLKAKRRNAAAAAKAIRDDAALTREQKHAKLRETRQNSRAEMRSVLTPEQQNKLGHLRQRARRALHRRTSL